MENKERGCHDTLHAAFKPPSHHTGGISEKRGGLRELLASSRKLPQILTDRLKQAIPR